MKVFHIEEVDLTRDQVNSYINQMVSAMPVPGCTDELACNYDSEAPEDDGSCEYAEENYDCDGNCLNDTDADGVCDELDDCPDIHNPYQHDRDEDGLADACDDDDDDDDGLLDCWNYWYNDGYDENYNDQCEDVELTLDTTKPSSIELLSSFPNPFNPSSIISFNVDFPQLINLDIYDINGYKIKNLTNKFYNQGFHQIKWTPDPSISSGVYIIRLESNNIRLSHKALYLK